MPTAGIVIIGDEILSGKFVEENAAFLIGELRALGVELRRIAVIPDDVDDIAATVTDASRRFDHVFTSGGVGPTHDDVTMAAIAKGFGTTVTRHPDLEAKVRGYWKDQLADANLRLADVPAGAELVYPGGRSESGPLHSRGKDQIWPVVAYRNVYILPGVPTLFRRKFVDIRDRFRAQPVTAARLYIDIEEGELAPLLDAVVAAHPVVRIGSYPRFSERDFRVLVTLEAADAAEVAAAFEQLAASLGTRVVRREEPHPVGAA
ncbi:MAG: competence/damage-inducible protein A [Deltaproteobacteria bacterium]|nr:competence/damage-inducible protein A [Deltaproteobacteria bacterium]